VGRLPRRGARIHDQVDGRQQMLVSAKIFPHEALEPIPVDGVARGTNTDSETQSWMVEVVHSGADEKQRVTPAQALPMDGIELRFLSQAPPTRQAPGVGWVGGRFRLRGQTARRLRPLARRRLRTRRPPLVAMRARKP
jgi:hypothetical protein